MTSGSASLVTADLLRQLQPLRRSLTGNGVRETLSILQRTYRNDIRAGGQFDIFEVPTGTPVLDWEVPNEWNLHDAWISDSEGNKLIDINRNGLHVVGYSEAVSGTMTFAELEPHLHSLPGHADRVPYRTSYFKRQWGFCVSEEQREMLRHAHSLTVRIDASYGPGHLTYGQIKVPGSTDRTIVLSTHVCHPWLANDNLSGLVGLTELVARLSVARLNHNIVALYSPGTVGPITWLARNQGLISTISGGLVLTGLGDKAPLTYKQSRQGGRLFDRVMKHVITRHDDSARLRPWDPYGYDERQFCSPKYDLAVGRLTRGVHGEFSEYHTSADDLDFCDTRQIDRAIDAVVDAILAFDRVDAPRVTDGGGEPQLGRRGLYGSIGGAMGGPSPELSYLWALSLSDGDHTIADIAHAAQQPIEGVVDALRLLRNASLIHPPSGGDSGSFLNASSSN
jgi:aminopeptidase-like protein